MATAGTRVSINTAYVERLNLTLRQDLAALNAVECGDRENPSALAVAARCISRVLQLGARAPEGGDDAGVRRGIDRPWMELGGSFV